MANAWGAKSTSWADDSDAAAAATAAAGAGAGSGGAAPVEDAFPSLEQARAGGKKKKPQAISLADFNSGKYSAPKRSSSSASTIFNHSDRLTSDEMLMLPTGPKERTEEELRDNLPGGRLGGAFQNYGGFRGDRGDRDRERGGERERGDRSDREGRGFGFEREREASRADDSNDWSVNKPAREERRGFRSGGGGGGGGGGFDQERFDRDSPSKADEADNWTAGKRFVPSERRDDFGRGGGKADADDNWGANKRSGGGGGGGGGGGFGEKWSFRRSEESSGPDGGDRWSRGGGGDPEAERWSGRSEPPRDEAPRRPRLNLQPRTLPVDSSPPPPAPAAAENIPSPNANPNSRPGTPEEEVKPRRKINPFGDAKPREVLLQERGQDWRKIDMQLENRRPEEEEERKLKQEIANLKELADSTGDPAIKEQVYEKEQELEQLSKDLDGKARVSEKASDRWRRDDPPPKQDHSAAAAPPTQESEWKRGTSDAWKRGENGRDGAAVARTDRW